MAVCAAYQVPHSVFLDWSQLDRDKAIWWHIRQAETCGSCGTRREEWDEKRGGDRNAYSADLQRCRGCEVRGRMEDSKEYQEGGRGVSVVLRRNQKAV